MCFIPLSLLLIFAMQTDKVTVEHEVSFANSSHVIAGSAVFRTQSEWDEELKLMNQPGFPAVDFARHTVVSYRLGVKATGGHSIKLVEIVEDANGIEVRLKAKRPGPNQIVTTGFASPVIYVVLSKTTKPIGFRMINESRNYN